MTNAQKIKLNEIVFQEEIQTTKYLQRCDKCSELATFCINDEFFCCSHLPRCSIINKIGQCQKSAEYITHDRYLCYNHRNILE